MSKSSKRCCKGPTYLKEGATPHLKHWMALLEEEVKTEKRGRDTAVGALGLQLKMRPTRMGYHVD